jgi:hypothetical protein
MAKRKGTKEQTKICKTLHSKLKMSLYCLSFDLRLLITPLVFWSLYCLSFDLLLLITPLVFWSLHCLSFDLLLLEQTKICKTLHSKLKIGQREPKHNSRVNSGANVHLVLCKIPLTLLFCLSFDLLLLITPLVFWSLYCLSFD